MSRGWLDAHRDTCTHVAMPALNSLPDGGQTAHHCRKAQAACGVTSKMDTPPAGRASGHHRPLEGAVLGSRCWGSVWPTVPNTGVAGSAPPQAALTTSGRPVPKAKQDPAPHSLASGPLSSPRWSQSTHLDCSLPAPTSMTSSPSPGTHRLSRGAREQDFLPGTGPAWQSAG